MSRLTDIQLDKLNTKRLLSYYKSERGRMHCMVSNLTYQGDIYLSDALYNSDNEPDVIEYYDQEKFCNKIKIILDGRENV